MVRHAKLACCVVWLVAIPLAASAQSRVPPMKPIQAPVQMAHPNTASPNTFSRPVTVTHPRIIRLPVTAAQRTASSTRNIAVLPNGTNSILIPGATSFDLSQVMNNNGAPGFGFDFTHLAALNGNLGEKAFIDPVTQQDIALAEQLSQSTSGFAGGFIPFWGSTGYVEPMEEEPQQQQPRVIVLQQPVPSTSSASPSSQETPSAPTEQQPPLPDVSPFTLVLHNGDQIKAVAFTRQKDRIVYITKEGTRNSFAASDLDVAATEQLNQDRGAPLHLSL